MKEATFLWRVKIQDPGIGTVWVPCQTPNRDLGEVQDALRSCSAYERSEVLAVEMLGQLGERRAGMWMPAS